MADEAPKKKRKIRSDANQERKPSTDWRGTIYMSLVKYPDKEIAERIDAYLAEFPGDTLSKLFVREMATKLNLPLTPEATMFGLIERMMVALEEQELQVESLTKSVSDLAEMVREMKASGGSFGRAAPEAYREAEAQPETPGAMQFLSNLVSSNSRRKTS